MIDSVGAGGAERSLLDLFPRLEARGVKGTLVCLHHREVGFEKEALESGIPIEFLKGNNRFAKIRSLRRFVIQTAPSLIYTSLFEADLIGRLATVGLDVPVVVGLVNTAYDRARFSDPNVTPWKLRLVRTIDRLLGRLRTDHFHAISEAVKDSSVESLGIPAERITVVPRGRDPHRMGERTAERRATARHSLQLPDDAELIVTVGRQEYQKGQIYLIEAFPLVLASRPQARLLIVGRPGKETPRIVERIADLGLESAISVLGHRSDVLEVLAGSDLFVFPSLYEGAGGALIEAMALSLPAVVSDIPSLREVVEEGGNADLVPPGDTARLASSIVALLADPGRLHRYGKRSREIFDSEFDADRAMDRLVDLLASQSRRQPSA